MNGLTMIEPQWLWLLAAVPVFLLLRWWEGSRRKKAMAKFSDVALFKLLNPTLQVIGRHGFLRLLFLVAAVTLLILSLARPGGNPIFVEQELTQKGVDIMLLVDLSSSMKATDLTPNRMQATKQALKQFINQMTTDRIGLVVFAGSVSMQSPLTQDYRTAKMMIDIINTDFLPVDGTAIGDVIQYGLDKIGEANRENAVIILLTDGENTKGQPPLDAVKKATEDGTRIYTIGIGTKEGAKIPDGEDEHGNPRFKTYMGEPVVTKLDDQLLEKIAKETRGKYFAVETNQALTNAYGEINRLTKTEHTEKKKKAVYQEYYVYPALLALLLLLLEMFLAKRAAWLFRRKKAGEHGPA